MHKRYSNGGKSRKKVESKARAGDRVENNFFYLLNRLDEPLVENFQNYKSRSISQLLIVYLEGDN